MNAIVLCGGKGTRLRPLTHYIQKTMLPIGPEERPLLEYVIRHLVRGGVDKIILSLDYKGHQIVNFFRDGSDFGVELVYVWRGKLKGTGNGVAEALEYVTSDDVIIYYGDTITTIDFAKMHAFHRRGNAAASVAAIREIPTDFGLLEVQDEVVSEFKAKRIIRRPADLGIYILKTDLRARLQERCRDTDSDFSRDIMPYFLMTGHRILAYFTTASWWSVNNLGQYEALKETLTDSSIKRLLNKR